MRSLSLLLLASLSLLASAAEATGERCGGYDHPGSWTERVLPRDGSLDVPVNTWIWLGYAVSRFAVPDPRELSLTVRATTDEGTVEVPVEIADVALPPRNDRADVTDAYLMARPVELLAPNTEHEVLVGAEVLYSFTTGDAVDATPPSSAVDVGDPGAGYESVLLGCHAAPSVELRVDTDAELWLVAREPLELAALDTGFPVAAAGDVWHVSSERGASVGVALEEGPGAFAIGAVDAAGNVTWEEVTVDVPADVSGCACVAPGTAPAPLVTAMLVGVFAIGARRRERHRGPARRHVQGAEPEKGALVAVLGPSATSTS